MGMTQCRELGLSSGTEGLRREGRMRKMTPGAGSLPQAGLRKSVELVRQKLHGDRCLTVRMIANELDMNCERV